MKPEEQRIAIAKACGWKLVDGSQVCWSKDGGKTYDLQFPDYLNDLDAMAEAEVRLHLNADKRALPARWRQYRDELAKVVGCAWYQSAELLRSTAAQRAEAFLRTLNLWKETK